MNLFGGFTQKFLATFVDYTMLREVGKRVSMDLLRDFLRQHVDAIPRTALRYAIELMSADEQKYWMSR